MEQRSRASNLADFGTVRRGRGSAWAGAVPVWTVPGLNNYRQNKQPDSEFGAPDAIVAVAPLCIDDSYSLAATVRNVGEAALPANVVVGFYIGEPGTGMKVGELSTTAPAEVKNGTIYIHAIVDDTNVPHPEWTECRIDNNTGTNTGKCLVVG